MTYCNGPAIIATSVIFIVLGVAAVAGRFYVRTLKHTKLGVDDWLALVALFFTICVCVTMIVGAALHSVGYHSPPPSTEPGADVTALPPIQITFEKVEYVINVLFPLAIGFIRLSILVFYRRIFRGKAFNIANWILIGLVSVWTVAFFFANTFPCGSDVTAVYGNFANLEANCIVTFAELTGLSISDVILDILVIALPIPLVWRLQMPNRQKLAVSFIFLSGTFAIAAGVTRMGINLEVNYFSHPGQTQPVLGLPAYDVVGIVGFTLFWQLIQVGVALVTANLPTLRPIFQGASPESLIGSIRSMISLHSMRPGGTSPKKSQEGSGARWQSDASDRGLRRTPVTQNGGDVDLGQFAFKDGRVGAQRGASQPAEPV